MKIYWILIPLSVIIFAISASMSWIVTNNNNNKTHVVGRYEPVNLLAKTNETSEDSKPIEFAPPKPY
jgi:hypothetical protein